MPIQDVISELNRIQAEGVITSYAVGGGIAWQEYIQVNWTEDLDVFVVIAGPPAPIISLTPIYANLVAHGALVEGMYLVIGGWNLQVLTAGDGDLKADAIAHSRAKDFGGGQIGYIMGPEHLAVISLETGRPSKDVPRIEEVIRRGKMDMAVFMQIIKRFGLQSKWNTFETRYLTTDA